MKKALSMLLAIVMVLSLLPMNVFAASNPTISLTTDFTTDLEVGGTFTVTANLAGNTRFDGLTLSLKWNENAVKFTGFNSDRGIPTSEVCGGTGYTPASVNNDFGIFAANDTTGYGYNKNGMLFVANFEIVGDGALGIGFKTDTVEEFMMIANQDGQRITLEPTLDLSAVQDLTVGGKPVGPAIPEGAPFTAITTDKGPVVEYLSTTEGYYGDTLVPYYHISIPEGTETVIVTHPMSVNPFVYLADPIYGGTDCVYGYLPYPFLDENDDGEECLFFEQEDEMSGGVSLTLCKYVENEYVSYEIPVNGPFSAGWDASYAVAVVPNSEGEIKYVVGPQTSQYAPICFFSFEFFDENAAPTYKITVEQPTGGTVEVFDEEYDEITKSAAGEYILVDAAPNPGYRLKHVLVNGNPVRLENGFFQMPAEPVTVSAVFEQIYTVSITNAEHGTVSTDKTTATAGEKVTLNVAPAEGYELDTLTVKQGENEIEVINNAFTMPAGAVTVSATFKKVVAGYRFATSADVSAENGGTAVVKVKITGHSNENVDSYNAYDVTLTFDSDKLELATDENGNYIYSGAVKSDNGRVEVDAENGTIRIVGCGTGKPFGTEIAALTFKTKDEGQANVTIDKVQVSDKETAQFDNVPEATPKHDEDDTDADETPDVSVVVVPYTVTKPDFISGDDKVVHGETYTFWYTDTTNYTYADLTVTVGGTEVTPTEENGVYTIAGVTGAIKITATQTPNSYNVTKPENVAGPDKATYGTPYIFTVTPSTEDMAIDTVKVTLVDGTEISYELNENGQYVIEGTNITGAFTITVTEKEKMTTVTFTGIKDTEIEGGLTQTAVIGQAFTFQLKKEEGYDYTVKVGETELTESEETAGQYTIPRELVVKDGVKVNITKKDNTKPVVDVTEYINLNGKTMFLVTAKWRDKVLAYGEEGTMFWSDKYTVTGEEKAGAYCWLVVSTDEMNTVELVKAAAKAAIEEAAKGATATAVKYDYDINGTIKVDVNDAQLAYDMYNASYMEFTDTLPMWKFLEADMETDAKLDTRDVAAIISYIVSGANA